MWEQGKSRNYLPVKVTANQSRQSERFPPSLKQGPPKTKKQLVGSWKISQDRNMNICLERSKG